MRKMGLRLLAAAQAVLCVAAACAAADAPVSPRRTIDSLSPPARKWFEASMLSMDACWDDRIGIMGGHVRETAFYAVGLLLRDAPGDFNRAFKAIEAVVKYQHDAPGKEYHGTFGRGPNEIETAKKTTAFKNYDPNWREFVGTTLAFILEEHSDHLPQPLVAKVDAALRKAADGAHRRNVAATYTNISLMSAFLMDYAGRRFGVPEWTQHGERLADAIYRNFCEDRTFTEYNSPIYYGVNLYALAEWRRCALSPRLREMGRTMEADLWRDVGRFYHAGLKNLCGPFDRTNSMDMRKWVSLCGMWIASVVPVREAPMPDITSLAQPGFRGDFCAMPYIVALGTAVPDDVLAALTSFADERTLRRVIGPGRWRVATACLSPDVMVGAQHPGGRRRGSRQFHPATVHWKTPGGEIGWIRLKCSAAVNATAGRNALVISFRLDRPAETCFFEVFAPGAAAEDFGDGRWSLPGLTVAVRTNAPTPTVAAGRTSVKVTYPIARMAPGETVTFRFLLARPDRSSSSGNPG